MNILHVESSMNWGGQEYRTLLESQYLNNNGHKSWIMCHSNSQFYYRAKEYDDLNVVPINLLQRWRIDIAIKILIFCIKNKVDIINTHSSKENPLMFFCKLWGIPVIRSRQITNPIKKIFSYKFFASHILATAEIIKKILLEKGLEEKKVTVIGEGVDLNEYNPNLNSENIRKEFNIKEDDFVIINIGIIRPDKGQEFYLEAANKIIKINPKIKFFLLGEGVKEKKLEIELRKKIKKYSIENNFFMPGYRNDIPEFIHLSNIVVVASVGTEAQSRIVPQAFATCRAVICTNVGGLPELVTHEENGLIIQPKDVKDMQNAIMRLYDDASLRTKVSLKGFDYAKKYLSFDIMMEKTLTLYNQLLLK